jgi:hypothetical protein
MTRECATSLTYSAEKGALVVGAERSRMLLVMLDSVPELVAWDAEGGTWICRLVRLEMFIVVAFGNVGL